MKSLLIAGALALAAPSARAAEAPRVVTITETANIAVVPDVMKVRYTVVNEADLATPIAQLVDEHNKRVAPTKEYLEKVCGKDGVCAIPQVRKVQKYNKEKQQYETVGNQIVTTVEAVLEGERNIETNLGKLFDSNQLKVDDIGSPVPSLSDGRLAEARREGFKQNTKNAVADASALLEPGETLGRILQRGDQVSTPSIPAYRETADFAPMAAARSAPSGEITVETGRQTVRVVNRFLFEVEGRPDRLAPAQQQATN